MAPKPPAAQPAPAAAGAIRSSSRAADQGPEPSLEQLTANLLQANAEAKRWKDYKDSITARLSALHAAGQIPTKFDAHGHTFALQAGKRSIRVDTIGKGQQAALLDQLMAQGHATEAFGDPFWLAREIKAPQGQAPKGSDA